MSTRALSVPRRRLAGIDPIQMISLVLHLDIVLKVLASLLRQSHGIR
jgi:hypothetical protein